MQTFGKYGLAVPDCVRNDLQMVVSHASQFNLTQTDIIVTKLSTDVMECSYHSSVLFPNPELQ